MGDAPFANVGDVQLVRVHPVAVFSILDHYMRRNDSQTRVIGSLMGSKIGSTLEIQNCFPVPHVEKNEDVAVGKDFNRVMMNLHQKVSPNEDVIGWYATALETSPEVEQGLINTQSCQIHDYYSSECLSPIHLVVDTNMLDNKLGIKAFVSTPLSTADRSLAAAFRQVKVEIACDEPERIGLGVMTAGGKGGSMQPGNAANMKSEMNGLEGSLKKLYELLESVQGYVERVAAGKEQPNNQLGHQIAQVVAEVPRIQPEVFAKSFQNNLKDLLMLVYLSNMTRAQLAVAERLGSGR